LTGVIYAAIVVAWAAYLVPLALRRHDEAARSRSIERFSSAMRVLSRRGESGSAPAASRPDPDPLRSADLRRREPKEATRAGRPSRAAQRAAAARRRRVLWILLGLTAVTGIVSAFAVVPWWSFTIPLALVVLFLVVARRQVARASDAYWAQAADAEPEAPPSNVVPRTAARVDASHGAPLHTDPDDEPTVKLRLRRDAAVVPASTAGATMTEERVEVVALDTNDGDSLWDPLPITLPTYVDKPAAARTVRSIDLSAPDTWSSGHSAADSQTVSEAAAGAAESDLVGEPRRAANG